MKLAKIEIIFSTIFFKHQDTRNKIQTISNEQLSKSQMLHYFIFGNCDLFVSCILVFGY